MTARQILASHLQTHRDQTGFDMPWLLEDYLVDLLTVRLTRTDVIPEPSFAERYLLLFQHYNAAAYKDYADSALFFCSLLPDYGRRRGLGMDYYASLGISTYYALGDLAADSRYTQLGNWFYHLQKFLYSLLHAQSRLDLVRNHLNT